MKIKLPENDNKITKIEKGDWVSFEVEPTQFYQVLEIDKQYIQYKNDWENLVYERTDYINWVIKKEDMEKTQKICRGIYK